MQNEALKLKEVLDGRQDQGNSGSGRRSCWPSLCVPPGGLAAPACPSKWSYILHWVTPEGNSVQCANSSVHLLLCRLGPGVPSPILKMSLSLDGSLQKMAPLPPAACACAKEGSQKNLLGMASFTADGRARPWILCSLPLLS